MKQRVRNIKNSLLLDDLSRFSGRLSLVGALTGIVLLVVLFAVPVARGQEASTRGISISPLTFEFRVDPGQVVTDEVRIFNSSTETLFAVIKIEDTTPTGERGQAVIGEAGSTAYSIASWTRVEQDVIEVKPGEQRVIPFTVTIPLEADPGGHYGAITIENTPGDLSSGGAGVVFAQKVAALMLVSVSGEVTEEVALTDFFISTEKTTIRFDWIPTNWILDPEEITFVARFENTGSVHEKPAGFITVTSALGTELTKIPLDQRNVLPGSARVVEVTWVPEGLTMGKIRAQVDAIYGSKNEPLFAAAEFWIIPVKKLAPWVIGGFFALIFVLLFRKRLMLALRIIIRGDKSGGGGGASDAGKPSTVEKMAAVEPQSDTQQPPPRPTVT